MPSRKRSTGSRPRSSSPVAPPPKTQRRDPRSSNSNNPHQQHRKNHHPSDPTATATATTNKTPTTPTATICHRIQCTTPKRSRSNDDCYNENDSIILEELLHPYSVTDFLNRTFRKHAVHVQWNPNKDAVTTTTTTSSSSSSNGTIANPNTHRRTTNRFPNVPLLQALLEDPDIPSLVRNTSSESVFVWLTTTNTNTTNPATTTTRMPPLPHSTSPNGGNTLPSPPPPPLIQSIEIPDPEAAIHLHQIGGHGLYCRAPPELEQTLVASLLTTTGLGCGSLSSSFGRGEVEMFIGGHPRPPPQPPQLLVNTNFITGWHYDFQENFTIQISGRKRWTLHPGMVQHPLRACTPHYNIAAAANSPVSTTTAAPDSVMESQVLASRLANDTVRSPTSMISTASAAAAAETPTSSTTPAFNTAATTIVSSNMEIVDMSPGDVLYFPAGMWHTVETMEPGLSINISLMASNYATITCQALQHFLLRHDEWRQCIQNINGSAVEHLQTLIQSLPNLLQTAMDQHEWSAHMILPPVLYEPLTSSGNEYQDPNDDDDDDDDDGEQEENGDSERNSNAVVDITKLVLPHIVMDGMDVLYQWPVKSHRLYQNPLATLLHEEDEIRNCYTNFQPGRSDDHYFSSPNMVMGDVDNDTKDRSSIYVLNVNFAGNESHDSLIRYRLLLKDEAVQSIRRAVGRQKLDDNENSSWDEEFVLAPATTQHHVNCLVYYGFLTWEKIQAKESQVLKR